MAWNGHDGIGGTDVGLGTSRAPTRGEGAGLPLKAPPQGLSLGSLPTLKKLGRGKRHMS